MGDDVTIDALTGEIKVSAIDRDARQEQTFTFNIIACEVNLPGECITQSVVFLITDLNNQIPEITVSPQVIEIDENFYGDLDITISVTDLDLV